MDFHGTNLDDPLPSATRRCPSMLRKPFPVLLVLPFLFACSTLDAGTSPEPTATGPGPKLSANGSTAAPSGDQDALPDFTELRNSFGERDDFTALCESNRDLNGAAALWQRNAWQELLELTTPRIEACPVDIDYRLLHALALEGLGREREAELHLEWFNGLIESILASGDGKSAETAWVVISVFEEYSLMRALGMHPKRQALLDGGIDEMTVEIDGQPETTVYFDPAAHFRRMAKLFE